MIRRAALALVAGLGLAAGCGPAPAPSLPDLAPLPDATMTLGSADGIHGTWRPIVAGQDATLIEGAQGGFHVWMRYRIEGLPAGVYRTTRTAYRVSDNQIVLRILPERVEIGPPGEGGVWEYPDAVPMFMCPSPIGIRIVDERIRYEIAILGDDGAVRAHAKVEMVPRCPAMPAETKDFCFKICTG